jgi:hypothetical protein
MVRPPGRRGRQGEWFGSHTPILALILARFMLS